MERRRAGLIVMALTVAALGPALLLAGRQAGDAGAGTNGDTGWDVSAESVSKRSQVGGTAPVGAPRGQGGGSVRRDAEPQNASPAVGAVARDTGNGENLGRGEAVRLSPEEYTDRRVALVPGQTVEIVLPADVVGGGMPLTVRSEDGGVLEGRDLAPELSFGAGGVPNSISYTVGRHRGLYVVSLYVGDEDVRRLEFWAGEPLPKGEPGPSRKIMPPEVEP